MIDWEPRRPVSAFSHISRGIIISFCGNLPGMPGTGLLVLEYRMQIQGLLQDRLNPDHMAPSTAAALLQ